VNRDNQKRAEHDQGLSEGTSEFDLTQIKAHFKANRTEMNQHLTKSQPKKIKKLK